MSGGGGSARLTSVVANLQHSVAQLGQSWRSGDSKYFSSFGGGSSNSKKGELQELKDELKSSSKEKKKEAVKKVIATMTIGKDVSSLFPDVVNCMQTGDMELKKLVYLYVINYAKVQPEVAILAVNTFRKDSADPNPLVRALAVRTMGCIRLEQILEYLVEPLRAACKDTDPYVRKTAATCICKLYETSPETVIEQGFLTLLRKLLLEDSNATVVANAAAALAEICESACKDLFEFDEASILKLLAALSECTEWGQVFILDALSAYAKPPPSLASSIVERVSARLSHANPAVVLSTARLILIMLDIAADEQLTRAAHKKLGPPLVTLLSSESELQYVALRSIGLLALRFPSIFAGNIPVFFCKYNDPPYVKLEKLEILVRLADPSNFAQVLLEFKEYASEIDVEFVRRTIRAIGHLAIKVEAAAEKCVGVLLTLVEAHYTHVVQEVFVVMRDVFRRYPGKYEGVIKQLCEALDSLDDAEAKAALVWIVGEYAERIGNSVELLEALVDNFVEEPLNVKLQLLTAVVKLFLKKPQGGKSLATRILRLATEESDDSDLRDRGFIYWRLLATDPEAAKKVVLCDKLPISDQSCGGNLTSELLDVLLANLSTLASVFYKSPDFFAIRLRQRAPMAEEFLLDVESRANMHDAAALRGGTSGHQTNILEDDILSASPDSHVSDSRSDSNVRPGSQTSPSEGEEDDAASSLIVVGDPADAAFDWPVLLDARTPGQAGVAVGLEIRAKVERRNGQHLWMRLFLTNHVTMHRASSAHTGATQEKVSLSDWVVQIKRNPFGITAAASPELLLTLFPTLFPGKSLNVDIRLRLNAAEHRTSTPPSHPLTLEVAVKNAADVWFLHPLHLPFKLLLSVTRPALDKAQFRNHWERMGEVKQLVVMTCIDGAAAAAAAARQQLATPLEEQVSGKLKQLGVLPVVFKDAPSYTTLYCSAVLCNQMLLLCEIALQKKSLLADDRGVVGMRLSVRADAPPVALLFQQLLLTALDAQKQPLPSPQQLLT